MIIPNQLVFPHASIKCRAVCDAESRLEGHVKTLILAIIKGVRMMQVSIEETLEYNDLPSELKLWVISDEIIEGARLPLIFLQLLKENHELIGKIGRRLTFPTATQLSASGFSTLTDAEYPEKWLANNNFTVSDKTISRVNVDVTMLVYCAVEVSDVLLEDMPAIDWVRLNLRNAGKAIGEYMESAAYALFEVGKGYTHNCATLTYGEIIDAKATMKNAYWIPEGFSPFLVVSPDAEATLLKNTDYITTERYTAGQIATMVQGESGQYAGCHVLVSPLLDDTGDAFIIFPNDTKYGTVSVLVWKRTLRVKSDYELDDETTKYVSTVRYGMGVVQSGGVLLFQISASP